MDEFGQSPLGESSKRAGNERCAVDNNNNSNGSRSKRELFFDGPGDVPLGERDNSCGQLEEADLYGDLFDQEREGIGILRLKVSKMTSDIAVKESMIEQYEKVTKELKEEVNALREENQTLQHNISSLFNTAKLEIERKDKEISSLRKQVQPYSSYHGSKAPATGKRKQ